MWTPSQLLPEMTSRAVAVVPPIVLSVAPFWITTPLEEFGEGVHTCGVSADMSPSTRLKSSLRR